jgi:hypothetical protein
MKTANSRAVSGFFVFFEKKQKGNFIKICGTTHTQKNATHKI